MNALSYISDAKGTTRNVTQLFKSSRQANKKKNQFALPSEDSGHVMLLDGIPQSHLDSNPLKELPPVWVDTYDRVIEDLRLADLKSILYSVTQLNKAQSERLKMAFGDTVMKDREITGVTQQLSKVAFT